MDEYLVAVALFDGVEELDFAGPYEVLTQWARESERPITVRTVAESRDRVRCSHGLSVVPDVAWAEALADAGTLMTSVCTGALVYGAAGLLRGRRATTH
jgi:transcriptional regulator GlxA family with amidase domain